MSVRKGYELLDHTADVGIRAVAPTPEGVVEAMTEGFRDLIGDVVTADEPEDVDWAIDGDDRAVLIRDYLTELHHLFESKRRVVVAPTVEHFDENRLVVRGRAFAIDEAQTSYHQEIKAITYYGLEFREIEGGYQAEVIIDV